MNVGQELEISEILLQFEMIKHISLKRYFGYIRVSTPRQGQIGTSLIEQRSAIRLYAEQLHLSIIQEFTEQETAAKQGRPVFREMIKALRQGKASGIIIHKIDRSARNLKDWAELGELIDAGIEVHFANENLDLYSRGGRLSADIQAVIAADFIRNLREETKKGFYGRLRQGLYPMPAPLGYLNSGRGKPKVVDPAVAPLIKTAFELYSTGNYGLRKLSLEMNQRGLAGKNGQALSLNGISKLLRNLFYIGIIHIKTTGEYHVGKHQPIIKKDLFEKVQQVLRRRTTRSNPEPPLREAFLFRKLLTCQRCRRHLIGEKQKDYSYYRCHTRDCPQKTIRSEIVEQKFSEVLRSLRYSKKDILRFEATMHKQFLTLGDKVLAVRIKLRAELEHIQNRLLQLTDNLIKGTIDQSLFVRMKNELTGQELAVREQLDTVEITKRISLQKTKDAFQFTQSASVEYSRANYTRKRAIIQTITEAIYVENKAVAIKLQTPFAIVRRRIFD